VGSRYNFDRMQRELHRLRTSPSFRLGLHLTSAIRRPWRAPFLIITLPTLMFRIGLELIGILPQPRALLLNEAGRPVENGSCVVMFPTNGVGFGHFTRMLAVAKRMKNLDPALEVIFFTTMPTLHLLKPYGIPAHHIAGPKYFKGFDSQAWNALLEEELNLCIDTHRPSMFIFDGAYPYRGMLRAIQERPSIKKLWMRRGTFRTGTSIPVDSTAHFDALIFPQDSVQDESEEKNPDVEIITSSPIVMLDESELLSKNEARARLGLPTQAFVVYVQLGAGEINDIESEVRLTVNALLEHPDVYVVLGESLIGARISIDLPRFRILRDYPNSMYFSAFDATIQAGGYNSYHETRRFGLPALFYPNMSTGMDDQLKRCKAAENEGWGMVLERRTKQTIQNACNDLILNSRNRNTIQESINGADQLADILVRELHAAERRQ
jgi:UDP-N-acetylglucosamine--N-acetylmuramyl-(pentapeptide) pyrophosphoryl-undecaprenol N-acetylglucosamine transferase